MQNRSNRLNFIRSMGRSTSSAPHFRTPTKVTFPGTGRCSLVQRCELLVKALQKEWLTKHLVIRFHDFELTIGPRLTDVDILGSVVVLVDTDLASGTVVTYGLALERLAHLVHLKAARLFHRRLPQVSAVIGKHHRTVDCSFLLHHARMILCLQP